MLEKFDKSLLLCPSQYSLHGSLKNVLKCISNQIYDLDIRHFAGRFDLDIHPQVFRLPYSIRTKWENYFLDKLNQGFKDYFKSLKPNLIIVYNSEFLTPETCKLIKKTSKLIFFLGDSPFYTTGNNNNLSILKYADLILSPDTFWNEQLNTIGLLNTAFFLPCINTEQYFELGDESISKEVPVREVLYVGSNYANSWGYKKALFMNQFVDYDLHIFGSKHWKKWFNEFPELKNKFTECDFIPVARLNTMMNRSKIMPVDGNPGILNGFHLRLFEALGAGALPVVEYRSDVEHELFKGCKSMVPLVRDYRKAGDIAGYYLKNDIERGELAKELKAHILLQYSPQKNAERIMEWLSSE